MPYVRMNPIECDAKFCHVTGAFFCGTQLLNGGPILQPMKEWGLDRLTYTLDEEEGGLRVGDYLTNTQSELVLKRACAEAIVTDFAVGPYELIPAEVKNEKGRIHAADVVVLHPVLTNDCLDWEKSQLGRDKEYPLVRLFGAWSLKGEKIPPDLDLFRVKGLLGFIFSERLVEFIRQKGFENFVFENAKVT
jgi:hypothetical protein